MSKAQRPLSPHLQIYRPQLTSTMSIFHRFTGVGLVVGLVALVFWLACVASNAECYECFRQYAAHPLGRVVMIGISFSYFYHLLNGIRHLVWDAGYGFDLPTVYRGGYLVLILTAVATVATWAVILSN